jgi:hypothetical protein
MDGDAQAFRYRERAEEVRVIAGAMKDRASRDILLGVADDYDQMARVMDGIAITERALQAHKVPKVRQ